MLKLNDKQTDGEYELKQEIKLNNLRIDILYNDEIDHELERENLIKENDKIAVCISGGKDSITMLNGLKALQRFYPKKFELIAISINPGFEFFDNKILQKNNS